MFKISPIQDENTKQKYLSECGTKAIDGSFAYQMVDQETGELMGISQFDITSDGACITDLKTKIGYTDFEAMFILGRATMNFIDMCGIHTCSAKPDAGEERLLLSIGFKKSDNGLMFCDMTNMFSGHCDGEGVKIQ